MIYNNITYVKPDLDDIYPIGSIYISTDNTNPAQLFGGTWERIEDKFLLAAGSEYYAGTEGGSPTQTLLNENLPRGVLCPAKNDSDTEVNISGTTWQNYNLASEDYTATTLGFAAEKLDNSIQFGHPINTMPPYFTVYMWKRIDVIVKLISFSIENSGIILGTFTAEQDMTWQNWIDSVYNEGFSIENGQIRPPEDWSGVYIATGDGGEAVSPNNLIIDNYTYHSYTGG